MTQKAVFTREAIVEAAFSLTREQGWSAVTARSIARKLGSSTMPIYSSMKSMEEIEAEVRGRVAAFIQEYQARDYGGGSSLNMAIGYVTFARDEGNLFRFLYVDRPTAYQVPAAMNDARVLKSWIFTHGLASLVSAGVLELTDRRIRDLLMEAGAAFFGETAAGEADAEAAAAAAKRKGK